MPRRGRATLPSGAEPRRAAPRASSGQPRRRRSPIAADVATSRGCARRCDRSSWRHRRRPGSAPEAPGADEPAPRRRGLRVVDATRLGIAARDDPRRAEQQRRHGAGEDDQRARGARLAIGRQRDVDLLQRRAFLRLVELGDLVLARPCLRAASPAASARGVRARSRSPPPGSGRPACRPRCRRAAAASIPSAPARRAARAARSRGGCTSGFCSVADVRSTFSWTSRSVICARTCAAPPISASACLSSTMTPDFSCTARSACSALTRFSLVSFSCFSKKARRSCASRDRQAARAPW